MTDVGERARMSRQRGSWKDVGGVGYGRPKGKAHIRAVAKGMDIRIAKMGPTACPRSQTVNAA